MDSAATPSYGMMNGGTSGSHQAMAPPRAMAGGGTQLPRPPHRQMNSIKYNNNEASSSSQQPQQQQQQQQHAYYAQHDQYQPQHQSSSSSMMRPSTSSYSGASSSGAGPSTSHDSVYAPQRVYGKRDTQNLMIHHDPTRSGSHSPLIEDTREDPQQLQLHHPSTSRAYQQPPQMMMHQQPPMMMQQHQLQHQHQQQQHHNVLPPKLTMQAHQPTEMTVNHTTTPPVLHQLQPPPRHTPAQINHDNSNNVRQNMGEDDDEPLVLAEGGAGEGSYYAATTSPEKGHVFPDQERFLPIANISRLMKNMIPGSGKIAKEAKECVQECVSEFISFLTSEACEKCIAEKRKTITADDLYEALIQLGFDNYGEPMRNFLEKWRRAHKMVHSVPRLPFNIFDPRLLRKEMPMTEIPQGLNNLTIDDISSAQMNLDGTRTIEIDGAKVQIFTDSQVQEMEQEARATGKPVPFIMYKPTPLLNPRESEEKEPEIEVNENQAILDNEPIIITNDAHDLITEPDPTVREEGTTLKPLAVSDAVSPDGPMNPLLEETQMSIYIDPLTKQHYVAVEAEGAVKLYPITINESAGTMQIVGAEDEPMSISSSSLSQQQGPDDGQYGAQQQHQQHQQNDVLEINDTDVNAMFIQPMGATQNEEQDEDHPPTQSSSAIEGSPSRTTRAGAKRTRGDPEYVSPQHQPNVANVKRTRGMQHHQ